MNYTLSLTRSSAETLHSHLLGDRSKEQMAVTLCGVNRLPRELRLLVRDVILLPADAFRHQSAVRLELKSEVQAFIHQRAHRHGLIQVDWHSHPGSGQSLGFSATDDAFEREQAAYLAHRMDRVPYGSVVVNDDALDGRVWVTQRERTKSSRKPATLTYRPQSQPLQAVLMGDLQRCIPVSAERSARPAFVSPVYDRQVRAFGQEFQREVAGLRVGIVGLGGLGSAVAEHLARLGVQNWVLVDPDVVELSNLNRLVNAAVIDAQKARPKVYVARSGIRQSNPKATVRALRANVFDPAAQRALKACDLLIAATDNHSSRMALNRLAVQYVIPLMHVGFHVGVGDAAGPNPSPALPWEGRGKAEGRETGARRVTDVSGEFALPDLGLWCLQCAGIVDPQVAGWELAPGSQKEVLRQRGYIADTPAPAVGHLDGVVAALAAAEVHNLVHAFKPQQRYLVYDALRNELVPLQVTSSTNCPVCSPDLGVLGLGDLEPLPDYRRAEQVKLPPMRPANLEPTSSSNGSVQAVAPAEPSAPVSRKERVRRMQEVLNGDDNDWV